MSSAKKRQKGTLFIQVCLENKLINDHYPTTNLSSYIHYSFYVQNSRRQVARYCMSYMFAFNWPKWVIWTLDLETKFGILYLRPIGLKYSPFEIFLHIKQTNRSAY